MNQYPGMKSYTPREAHDGRTGQLCSTNFRDILPPHTASRQF